VPTFPPSIASSIFGTLTLKEIRSGGEIVSRNYQPERRPLISGARVKIAPEGVKLVIWPSEEGVPDPVAFAGTAEARWTTISSNLDDILSRALDVVDEGIDDFWGFSERPPTAAALLATVELRQINLNAGRGEHVLILFDRADLIGSHDLLIEIDGKFCPSSASFDG
jgi:hypothetical protein